MRSSQAAPVISACHQSGIKLQFRSKRGEIKGLHLPDVTRDNNEAGRREGVYAIRHRCCVVCDATPADGGQGKIMEGVGRESLRLQDPAECIYVYVF